MAINVNFAGISTNKPSALSQTTVNLTGGFPLAPSGIVGIVGEAAGGAPGSSAGVQTYTSQDLASLISTYKSGPIVDAARLLVQPARDNRVPNGAGIIRVYKTNASTKSTLAISNGTTTIFNLSSANYGEDENLISVTIVAGSVDSDARIITVTKSDTSETLDENPRDVQMDIQYTGSNGTATLTIQSGVLAVDAGGADDISITLAGKTIQDVVALINADANYTATTALASASFKSATDLDPISTATDVKTAAVDLYAQQKELLDIINGQSTLITAARVTNVEGTPAVTAKTFLTGGALGASSNTNFQSGFDALLSIRCNTVLPLVSRDASDLVTDGLTDASSSWTIDAVNLQAVTHAITASNAQNRSERNAYVSKKATFANAQIASRALNSERASMLFQDVEVLRADGNLAFLEPWAAAAITAGIQAGTSAGTPTTYKRINANGITHADYNEKTQVELAIDAGLTPLEELDQGGFRVVVGNTTYVKDANFVFNRMSVLEAADTVAFNLRQQLEDIFVGDKTRTGTAEAIKNTVVSIMTNFRNAELIVGDDTNDGLGFKDLTVQIIGNRAEIDVTITPVQGIDFILNRITLDDIRQTA